MSAIPTPSLAEIRAQHPTPWRTVLEGTGMVRMFDAAGREVPLFTITRFCELISAVISASSLKEHP